MRPVRKKTYDDIQSGDIVLVKICNKNVCLQVDELEYHYWSGRLLTDREYSSSVDRQSFVGFWNLDELCNL